MYKKALHEDFHFKTFFNWLKFKREFKKNHPFFFEPCGTCMFVGSQGSGKTLSGVNYVYNIMDDFPHCILVTNVKMRDYPFTAHLVQDKLTGAYTLRDDSTHRRIDTDYVFEDDLPRVVVEYTGLDCLKYINNGEYGVLYFIDELHLELNSLESKNIDIDVITEISQQRKQRKHIVGTSQIFMRLAKPVREQIKDLILCKNYFGCLQFNKLVDGETVEEVNGKLKAVCKRRSFYLHDPDYYERYDTFAKMKRLNNEWQGHSREPVNFFETQYLKGEN